MEELLSDIGSETLGLWKALLVPRPRAVDQAALSAAASTISQRHFEDAREAGGS